MLHLANGVFCSEDAHILNKQRGQLLMGRNNLFPAPLETEMKGVLGKKNKFLTNVIECFVKSSFFWSSAVCQGDQTGSLQTATGGPGALGVSSSSFPRNPRGCQALGAELGAPAAAGESCQHQGALQEQNPGNFTPDFGKTGPRPTAGQAMNSPPAGHARGCGCSQHQGTNSCQVEVRSKRGSLL